MIEATNRFPVTPASSIATVTAGQMAVVDRLAVDEFGIDILQMTEQAGFHLAELVRAELGGQLRARRVVVAVGSGNNGAGGLVAARHLSNHGAVVRVLLARPVNRLTEAGRHQLATLLQMSIDCSVAIYDVPADELEREFSSADAIVDAVLGYGGAGAPRDGALCLVEFIGRTSAPVISLDLPSGLDPDTGEAPGAAVTATATLTLALPKPGLFCGAGRVRAGRVHLADIGLPAALFRRLGVDAGMPFAPGPIVRLEGEV